MSIRSVIDNYNIRSGNKDQYFLINESIINSIVCFSKLSSSDIVIEVGGGIGNLSERIARFVKKLYIIEIDKLMVGILKKRLISEYKFNNIEIIHCDVLSFNFSDLNFTKIISNLPYSISSKFTVMLSNLNFELAIIMYQEEFARRLLSRKDSKDYSRLTILIQEKKNIRLLKNVSKYDFFPIPKVNSSILEFTSKTKNNNYNKINEDYYNCFISCIFNQRRKKLINIINSKSKLLNISNLDHIINNAKISNSISDKNFLNKLNLRPENLSINEIIFLSNYLYLKNNNQNIE